MIKRLTLGVVLLVAAASVHSVSLYATQNNLKDDNTAGSKVTLCHATNSATNPYVKITVSVNAAGNYQDNGRGDHSHHLGPIATSRSVAEQLKNDKTHWGDIIPAGDKNKAVNWPDGKAIFDNGCKYVASTLSNVIKNDNPAKNKDVEDIDSTTQAVLELPRTGGNSMILGLVLAGVVYALASFSGSKLLHKSPTTVE